MLLALLPMSLGDSDPRPERIIARCAATSVRYGDIAISLNIVTRLARLSKGPKGSGLSDEETRHAVEQERLDRMIASLLSSGPEAVRIFASTQEGVVP